MEISKGKLIFILSSVGFVVVGWFVSLFLLVGAGFGALGMFFLFPFFEKYVYESKKRKLIKLQKQIAKLNGEVYG